MTGIGSRQVDWWSVHEYVDARLADVASWPMAGTPEWCALDDTDPAKTAALLDAAQHWALRMETCQQARCEASKAIAAAADWKAIAWEKFRLDSAIAHGAYYIPRTAS
jgi:Protein of unknown function (DUF2742)